MIAPTPSPTWPVLELTLPVEPRTPPPIPTPLGPLPTLPDVLAYTGPAEAALILLLGLCLLVAGLALLRHRRA